MVFHVSCCNRHSCLVRTKYNSLVHGTFCSQIVVMNHCLKNIENTTPSYNYNTTYTLLPCELPTHEVSPTSLALMISCDVQPYSLKMRSKVRIVQNIPYHSVRVTAPHLVLLIHL